MKTLMKKGMDGIDRQLMRFAGTIAEKNTAASEVLGFAECVYQEMRSLGYDRVDRDKAGNIIGTVKGYQSKNDMVLITHMDLPHSKEAGTAQKNDLVAYKAGIISGIYSAAILKRTLAPLTGDLVVCCVPRSESCDHGIKYLFENYLKKRLSRIRGVVLCEPTDLNVYLGHKGRMEYEIVVRGRLNRDFLVNRGINMLGTMFPLVNELEKVSRELPSDYSLGRSNLRIKDVRYSGYQPQEEVSEFKVVVDRVFIPEETSSSILTKAKTIAKNVYKGESDLSVSTVLAREMVKTYTGLTVASEKEFKPWAMEGHQPFVKSALEALTENKFLSSLGFWKKIVTEGSYTYGSLNIPTIGFGAGSEDQIESADKTLSETQIKKAACGLALIVERHIGMPAFGWSADEI